MDYAEYEDRITQIKKANQRIHARMAEYETLEAQCQVFKRTVR